MEEYLKTQLTLGIFELNIISKKRNWFLGTGLTYKEGERLMSISKKTRYILIAIVCIIILAGVGAQISLNVLNAKEPSNPDFARATWGMSMARVEAIEKSKSSSSSMLQINNVQVDELKATTDYNFGENGLYSGKYYFYAQKNDIDIVTLSGKILVLMMKKYGIPQETGDSAGYPYAKWSTSTSTIELKTNTYMQYVEVAYRSKTVTYSNPRPEEPSTKRGL
jgi:hypothetical protein